jgi:hypothetical protein
MTLKLVPLILNSITLTPQRVNLNSRPQTSNLKPQTSNLKPQTSIQAPRPDCPNLKAGAVGAVTEMAAAAANVGQESSQRTDATSAGGGTF